MPIRFTGIYKAYHPGDLASFPLAETETIVKKGLGVIEDPIDEAERALAAVQTTLPAQSLVADIVARPSIAEPSPAYRAIPDGLAPAPGITGPADGVRAAPAIEAVVPPTNVPRVVVAPPVVSKPADARASEVKAADVKPGEPAPRPAETKDPAPAPKPAVTPAPAPR